MISFAEKYPDLVSEWAKENEIRPESISYGSNKKVIWNGSCGHTWTASIKNRGNNHGCPYCSGNKVLKGVNDLATLYPQLVEEWDESNRPLMPDMVSRKAKDNADTIEGNCDTTLFLGGKEKTTLKEMSEILGKETIDLYNTSDTRGQSPSYGLNYQKTGKELMSQDEIAVMDGGKCILQLRGVRPFFSDKFDITKHKRYKELSDFDEANLFDVEAFLSTKLKMKKSQIVETYEMGVIEDDA